MSESTKRTPRESESREQKMRPNDAWNPASALPTPEPKDGYIFRWVRTRMLDKPDLTNVSRKFREGWEPVKADEHPELKVMSDLDSRWPDGVEIGGLLLCKIPEEIAMKRREHFEQTAQSQMDAVDHNYLRENDPRMPLLDPERKSRTSFGRS